MNVIFLTTSQLQKSGKIILVSIMAVARSQQTSYEIM